MASEIIQLPQNGGNQNGGTTLLPVANGGGGLFGNNGQTSLTDILGFAVIASIFPNIFGNGNGYGNRGNCGGCGCPAVDTQLAL